MPAVTKADAMSCTAKTCNQTETEHYCYGVGMHCAKHCICNCSLCIEARTLMNHPSSSGNMGIEIPTMQASQ